MNPLVKRIVTALSTAALVVLALICLPLSAVLPAMILLALLVQLEFSQLVAKRYETMPIVGIVASSGYFITVFYYAERLMSYAYIPMTFAVAVFFIALAALFGRSQKPMEAMGSTILSFVYIPFMLTFFMLIPVMCGMKWLLYIIAIVKISDMGGFAFGKAFGKRKMCPAISPNKSWEGLAGSVFASCVVSCAFIPMTDFAWYKALAFGVAAALIGTLGDLVESRFKREVGVKDSATFMPAGLGGFLDMFDSLVFAPALFFPFL